MLVIRRREGEGIVIDGGIEVLVNEVSGGRVKLCILAPPQVEVLRKEVHLTREANRSAGRGGTPLERLAGLAARLPGLAARLNQ